MYMRTEIYSLRSAKEEILYIEQNKRNIVKAMDKDASIRVLFKTEIDATPKKIRNEFVDTFNADNPPEFNIYANALDTKDSSSFRRLFTPLISLVEKELKETEDLREYSRKAQLHLNIMPIMVKGQSYPAYCFRIINKKLLVLPRMKFIKGDYTDYMVKAVNLAKDALLADAEKHPAGYIMAENGTPIDKETAKAAPEVKAPVTPEIKAPVTPEVKTPEVKAKPAAPAKGRRSDRADTKDIREDLLAAVNNEIPTEVETVAKPSEATPEGNSHSERKSHRDKVRHSEPARNVREDILAAVNGEAELPAHEKKADPAKAEAPAPKKEKKEHSHKRRTQEEAEVHNLGEDLLAAVGKDTDSKKDKTDISKAATNISNTKVDISKPEIKAEDKNSSDNVADNIQKAKDNDKKKGSFKDFVLSFIPHKGDNLKSIILKIVVLVAIAVFFVGGYMLLDFYLISPSINSSDITDIQNIFYQGSTVITTDAQGNIVETAAEKNWEGLKKINDEIVGWVKVDNTEINYPVLLHEGDNADSQYYLYRNYKEKQSDFGSIFVDYRCPEGLDSRHVILHGHNMGSDNSMFGMLTKYPGNPDFYKKAALVELDTPEVEGDYIIFAVMKINVSNDNKAIFNYLMGDFDNDAQYMNFIYNIKERSYFNIDVPINETDKLLTLSTCSYERDNMRTVAVARKIREGEDVTEYINSVKKATPKSEVSSTFRNEFEEGNITWYDKTKAPEGDESLPFMEQADMFVVKFMDATGKKAVSTQHIIKGKDAKAPENNPRKAAADGYYYTFKKWDKSFKNVTQDLVINPVFTKHKIPVVDETTRPTTEGTIIPDTPVTPPTPVNPEPPEVTTPPVATNPPEVTTPPETTEAPVTSPPETAPPATQAAETPAA